MSIGCAVLMCHAPIVIPAIAGERASDCATTTRAMREAAKTLVGHEPDLIVLISPHTPRMPTSWGIVHDATLRGSFARFGHPEVAIELLGSPAAARAIAATARGRQHATHEVSGRNLDHGACVPLYFVHEAGYRGPVIVIALPWPPHGAEREFGLVLREAAHASGQRWAILASGDMSHRLSEDAPSGFDPHAHMFDEAFVAGLRQGHVDEALSVDRALVERAGEDVVQSTAVAFGAVEDAIRGTRVLAYEAPFGVGYCEAVLHSDRAAANVERATMPASTRGQTTKPPARLAQVALDAIEAELTGRPYEAPVLPEPWRDARAVFVTLRSPDGELRGCIGRTEPVHEQLAEEVADCAVAAATRDYRMPPIELSELANLRVEVSILDHPEPVADTSELDPERFGVVVSRGVRRGVLLPQIDGVDTAADQVRIALRKGGIGESEPYRIERFRVLKVAREPVGLAQA